MLISNQTLGDGRTLILSGPEGGTYVIPQLYVMNWSMNISSSIMDVTSYGGSMDVVHGLREVSGTLDFSGSSVEYYEGVINPDEAVIKQYSVSDMLRVVTDKLKDR